MTLPAPTGATGAELAAELYRATRTAVACGLDKIDPAKDLHIILIEADLRILPAPPERLSKSAEDLLCGLDMHMLTGAKITTKSARRRRSLPS
jgi:NADH dehydrogenase